MRSAVEIQGDIALPVGKHVVRLLISNSTQEPMLALERPDKTILVTATRPPAAASQASYYSLFNFFSFQKSQPIPNPNPNPYELSIETYTGPDIPKPTARGKLLKIVAIDNDCADSFERDLLSAAAIFTKHDNACSLVVNLLRRCTDLRVKEKWVNAIFDIDSAHHQSPILS